LAGSLELVDDQVSVDQGRSQLAEERSHRALSGADAACESDYAGHENSMQQVV
jgi:hypothetical protein